MPKGTNDKVLANKIETSHDYTILETIEARCLNRTEIKSVRHASI